MVKRLLSVCLTVLLVATALSGVAFASERTGEPITLNIYSINSGTSEPAKYAEAKEAIEQKIWEDLGINADITMIGSDSFSSEQIPVKIAAGELDAMYTNTITMAAFQDFVNKGILLPLDDLLAQYGQNVTAQIDPKLWDPYKFGGKTYLIPVQAPVPFYCSTWLRMDLLRKYGIDKVPETVSELVEDIKAVQAHEPDLIGMAAGHVSWICNSGPFNYHRVNADGNMTRRNDAGTAMEKFIGTDYFPIYWEDENCKRTLQRLADTYKEGVLDPEFFTTTFDHANELVSSDRVICVGESYGFQPTADRKAGLDPAYPVEPGKEQEWVHLSNLVNDINGAPTTWQYAYEVGGFISIISTTKHPEEIMKIFNWICASNDNYALSNWGVEGTHWNYTEDGHVKFVKDDADKNVVGGEIGELFENIRSDWWVPLTSAYYGTEWKKIFDVPPTTRTWTNEDGFINYQFKTDPTAITDMTTIANEAFVNIVTGAVGVDEGLAQMVSDLEKAGYDDYYAEYNEQYMKGMGYAK